MPHFRCYILNATDHIVSVDSVEAEEDALALSLAAGLLRERHSAFAAIEVWLEKRMVGRINNVIEKNPSQTPSILNVPERINKTGT